MKRYLFLLVLPVMLLGACDEDTRDEVEPRNEDSLSMYFPGTSNAGWETVGAEELGWNPSYLQQAIDFARERNSYSLMILHNGRIVSENYWQDHGENSLHHVESVAKSMVSFVIGRLQEQGKLDINDSVSAYLPEGWSNAPLDKEQQISIKDLLSMSSGLDENLNYLAEPGELWYYSHEAFRQLFGVIEAATGKTGAQGFDELLFSPVNITNYSWDQTDLSMNARDMARFGLLIQNNGQWKGDKLIDREGYFTDMLEASQDMQKAYGYLWWLNGQADYYDDKALTGDPIIDGPIYPTMPADARLAMGHFDQRIEVIPSLGIIVIRQGGDTKLPELGEGSFDSQFWSLLMKAVRNGEAG